MRVTIMQYLFDALGAFFRSVFVIDDTSQVRVAISHQSFHRIADMFQFNRSWRMISNLCHKIPSPLSELIEKSQAVPWRKPDECKAVLLFPVYSSNIVIDSLFDLVIHNLVQLASCFGVRRPQ